MVNGRALAEKAAKLQQASLGNQSATDVWNAPWRIRNRNVDETDRAVVDKAFTTQVARAEGALGGGYQCDSGQSP
jgi:hypothetical protein